MSSRLGRPKQLLDLHGKPLIVHVVERCLASRLDGVLVILGHEAGAIRQALSGLDVNIVMNPEYEAGQSTSLVAGLSAAGTRADAVVIVLGDQPGIEPSTIDQLIDARRTLGAPLAMAAYGGERGHPVLFGHELFDELREVTGDMGGREVVRRHLGDLVLVPAGADTVPIDVDTEEAYDRLLNVYRSGGEENQAGS
jgi:molybdenum cofactor cytidylyltransferase